MVIT
ncbi:hypothetical protein KSF78_0003350 [Schistosoma japonicum]|jgi:hypothetical protein